MNQDLDISAAFGALTVDLCRRVPLLGHIAPEKVLFCLSRSRARGTHGTYAQIAPLRFEQGDRARTRKRGRYSETYRMPSMHHRGREILYLVYILFPRFLRLSFRQKLSTLIHELYHISERCDGDIRRFPGRNFAHGSSRESYNAKVTELLEEYLASDPAPELLAPLRIEEEDWQAGEIRLSGLKVPLPRARLVARKPA